ncbi:hypothetical protein HU200_017346 [Digitaria exilis]|uniref:Uncharacterized protein n=1 Tax=Digitaria exilis TaxID=1010633 RepID=A0A835KK33_9POAL|nr:hypothetical protein HU200_017346 [Digitaria exilis]
MGRSPCCDENGLKKGPWTPEEDQKLMEYIQKHGHGSWRALPKLAGMRWSAIAKHLPGRTDNEIKNFWNTHLKKKLIQMGFDPMTHRPRTDFFSALPQLIALANLRQLVEQRPWDDHAARLQVEAVQAAKLQCLQNLIQSAASIATSPSSSSINTIPDLEQIGLLSPPQMSSLSSLPSPSFLESISGQEIVAGQLPDIQIPSSFFEQPTCNDANQNLDFTPKSSVEGENGTPKTLLLSENSLPPLTDFPISNLGDACSASSCDGSSIQFPSWPELFDEQFLSELV